MPCMTQFLREFFHVLHGRGHLVRHFYRVQQGPRYLLKPSRVESLGFSFPGISLDPLFCSSCLKNSRKPDSFVNVLEECNPIILVLILTLVLVGRLLPELAAVKNNFTSFLTIYLSFMRL